MRQAQGIGRMTTVFDTKFKPGNEMETFTSEKDRKEKCDKCGETGFVKT